VKIVICPPTYRPLLAKKKAEAKAEAEAKEAYSKI
jgi:hypothetical protein